jgi:hypothetical protein
MFPLPGVPVALPTESTFESFVPLGCFFQLMAQPALDELGFPSPRKTVFRSADVMFGVGVEPFLLRVTDVFFRPTQ